MNRIFAFSLTFFTASAAYAGETVPKARETFEQVSALIRQNYVDPKIGEEEIWSYALAGLVQNLMKTGDKPINELIDPREREVLEAQVKGSISGIGLVFERVEDMVVVREVLSGGPASKTRMAPKDRILAIDGKDVAGLSFGDVAFKIRGKAGTSVELLMQRGTEEWTETITRGQIQIQSVQGILHEGIAYVRLMHFHQDMPKRLEGVLADMKKRGARGLVLDLRASPGGLFDILLEVADRFLGTGETIVSLRHRDGKEVVHRAKKADVFAVPTVVLIGRHTASSAEILAAALQENGRATLMGEKTYGKGTVEKIFELDNGYALKLTIARFYSPKGNNWQGKGIEPDFAIPASEDLKLGYSGSPALDLSADPQLKSAFALLRMR